MIEEHMITSEKMRQVKDMITQLAVYCIMFASPIPNKRMTPLLNSIKNSFKELKNTGTDKLNNAILVDAGLAHNW